MQTRSKVNGNAEKEPSFGHIPRGRDEHEHREAVSHHGSNDRSIPVSFFVGVVAIVLDGARGVGHQLAVLPDNGERVLFVGQPISPGAQVE